MEITAELKFRSKYMPGALITVLFISIDHNLLHVELKPSNFGSSPWQEDWNLQHTIWGFERGDYLEEKTVGIAKRFYRHTMRRLYYGESTPSYGGIHFSESGPQEFVEEQNKMEKEATERRKKDASYTDRKILEFQSVWSLEMSHEITEEDYKTRKEFSIPINQYIFK